MELKAKKEFSKRLILAMLQHPEAAKPGTKWGVNSTALQKKADVSREMARRYLEGQAIPRPDPMKAICDWLGVRVTWLRDGEPPMRAKATAGVNEDTANYNVISETDRELLSLFHAVDSEVQNTVISLLRVIPTKPEATKFSPPHQYTEEPTDKKQEAEN